MNILLKDVLNDGVLNDVFNEGPQGRSARQRHVFMVPQWLSGDGRDWSGPSLSGPRSVPQASDFRDQRGYQTHGRSP